MNSSYLPTSLTPSGISIANRNQNASVVCASIAAGTATTTTTTTTTTTSSCKKLQRSLSSSDLSKMSTHSTTSSQGSSFSLRSLIGRLRHRSMSVREKKSTKTMTLEKIQEGKGSKKKCLPPLTRLAKNGQFDRISDILTNESHDDAVLAQWFENCIIASSHKSAAPLHVLLQRRPPVELVDVMCRTLERVYPGCVPEDAPDRDGITALTVAIKVGSDLDVIMRLLNGQTSTHPARSVDKQHQRLPLHWACMPVGRKLRQRGAATGLVDNDIAARDVKSKKAISTSTIRLLINAYPQARSIKDAHGQTPLDLAKKFLKKNYHHSILDDLNPETEASDLSKFMAPSSAFLCNMSNNVMGQTETEESSTTFAGEGNDIPREIFCIVGDLSHHKRMLQEGDDGVDGGMDSFLGGFLDGSDHGIDAFEQLEI